MTISEHERLRNDSGTQFTDPSAFDHNVNVAIAAVKLGAFPAAATAEADDTRWAVVTSDAHYPNSDEMIRRICTDEDSHICAVISHPAMLNSVGETVGLALDTLCCNISDEENSRPSAC